MHIPAQPQELSLPLPEQHIADADISRFQIPEVTNPQEPGFMRRRLDGLTRAWSAAKEYVAEKSPGWRAKIKDNFGFVHATYGDHTFNVPDSIRIKSSAMKDMLTGPRAPKNKYIHRNTITGRLDDSADVVRTVAPSTLLPGTAKAYEIIRKREEQQIRRSKEGHPLERMSPAEIASGAAYEVLTLGPIRMIGTYMLMGATEAAVGITRSDTKLGSKIRNVYAKTKARSEDWDSLVMNPVVAQTSGKLGNVRHERKQRTTQYREDLDKAA